jgi:hypothetical protein
MGSEILLEAERNGYIEESYLTSPTPIHYELGRVVGCPCQIHENII